MTAQAILAAVAVDEKGCFRMTNQETCCNSEHQTLREYIRRLERSLGLINDGEMPCCGVTMAQCHSIIEIGRAGQLSLIDLANTLNLDNSTMSRTVNHLVAGGLAERQHNPDDRRYVDISLTPAGKQIFDTINHNMNTSYAKLYAKIPEDKQKQVLEALEVLLEAFGE